jgi:hypothetical protein
MRADDDTPTAKDWPLILDAAEDLGREESAQRAGVSVPTVSAARDRYKRVIHRLRTNPRLLAEATNDLTFLELARGMRTLAREALTGDDTPTASRTLATLTKAARDLATARSVNATTDAKRPAPKQEQPQQQQPTGALDALETA